MAARRPAVCSNASRRQRNQRPSIPTRGNAETVDGPAVAIAGPGYGICGIREGRSAFVLPEVASTDGGHELFVIGAHDGEGGRSIICLHSTASVNGETRSSIVPALPLGTPVTTPRHPVQYVITEYGVANLGMLTARERRDALMLFPEFRKESTSASRSRQPSRRALALASPLLSRWSLHMVVSSSTYPDPPHGTVLRTGLPVDGPTGNTHGAFA